MENCAPRNAREIADVTGANLPTFRVGPSDADGSCRWAGSAVFRSDGSERVAGGAWGEGESRTVRNENLRTLLPRPI